MMSYRHLTHWGRYMKMVSSIRNRSLHSPIITRKSIFPNMTMARLESSIKLPKSGRTKSSKILKILTVGSTFAVIMVLVVRELRKKKEISMTSERQQSIGKAAIGGPWNLVDHDGNPASDKTFLGKWVLLYFGFCHCPDICPDELEKVCNAVSMLDKDKKIPSVTPIYITVDPSRDTPEVMKEYVQEFSPKLIGMTGTLEQVEAASKAYRVYFSAGPKDEDGDYIMDHTIITYLVNPKGEFVDYYGQNSTVKSVVEGVKAHIVRYKELNGSAV